MYRMFYIFPLHLSGGFVKGPIDPYGETKLNVTIFCFYSNSKDDSNHNIDRGYITGHAFIQIKNISGSYLTVGHHGLYNNSYFTVGCWPTPIIPITSPYTGEIISYEQFGAIWYNNESHDSSGWQNHTSYSLSTNTNTLGYQAICDYLTNGTNSYYELLTHTCANVAVHLWNMIAPSSLQLAPTFQNLPSSLKDEIITKTGYSVNSPFYTGSVWNYIKSSTGNLA